MTDNVRTGTRELEGSDPMEITVIGGGRNSRVYRVRFPHRTCVAKEYFRNPGDPRDRLGTEVQALRFLHENGVDVVPAPIAKHEERQLALFEHIEGTAVSAAEASASDVDEAVAFLAKLHALSRLDAACSLPIASEACFTASEIVASVRARRARLEGCSGDGAAAAPFRAFLEAEFDPALDGALAWAGDSSAPLPQHARTLSPSDFGFHNTLRRPDGRLAFVDFEYFGWDDPAKLFADFLLHPGMPLTHAQRSRFYSKLLVHFGHAHPFETRVRVAYGLFALKWCMILTNEFVPEHLARRRFVQPDLRVEELQLAQLAKARKMLRLALEARDSFPYSQ